MNILLISDAFPPQIDGVCNTVINYGRYLASHGHRVLVAAPYHPDTVDDYPFEVWRFPSFNTEKKFGYRSGFPFAPGTVDRLVAFGPDLIHAHCPIASAFLARELRDVVHVPVILTYHTKFDLDVQRAVKMKLLQKPLIRGIVRNVSACDDVWAVNRGAGENLKSLGFAGDYTVMPNGVDIDTLPCPAADLEALSRQYELDPAVPLFLFVGRVLWYKGLHYIIEGLAGLAAAGYAFRMAFVGNGEDLAAVKEQAGALGIADRCLFTGAVTDRRMLKAWYTLADLFLLPSVFDNNPLVVKEAAACGTPSVLVRASSAADGVTDRENGFLIEPSAAALTEALAWAVTHPEQVKKAGERAEKTLYVSWDESIAAAVERYQTIDRLHKEGRLLPHTRTADDGVIKAIAACYKLFSKF